MAKLYLGTREVTPVFPMTGKYSLLQRIKDDSNNDVGIVSGYVIDSNNNEFAVICLDAVTRGSGQLLTTNTDVPGTTALNNWATAFWGSYKISATENCNIIADYCTQQGYTSTAIDLCRSKSYIIDGVTYYGQAPTAKEVYDIMCNKDAIDTADPTASTYPSLNFGSARNMLTSSIYVANYILFFNSGGRMADAYITANNFVAPVLELPNR